MEKLLKRIDKLISKTKANFISNETLYEGKFIKLISEKYSLPNNKILYRERIEKNNNKESVIIVSITSDNKFILVVQNRINQLVSVEFPSGYIEENETIEIAAKRELKEETGYISNNITILGRYRTQLGIDSSLVNIVIARNCIKANAQSLSENEYINYDEFTFNELSTLIDKNIIFGCVNRLAFYEFINKKNIDDVLYLNR